MQIVDIKYYDHKPIINTRCMKYILSNSVITIFYLIHIIVTPLILETEE